MNHLQWYLSADLEPIRWPEDIVLLRQGIPELMPLTDNQIQELYEMYSDNWAASWLQLGDYGVQEFRDWLLSPMSDAERSVYSAV